MRVKVEEIYTYTLEVADRNEMEKLQSNDDRAGTRLVDKLTSGEAKLINVRRHMHETWD